MNLEPMRGKKARLHDCGALGRLTAAQIASHTGLGINTVYQRPASGLRGDRLVALPDRKRSRALAAEMYMGRTVHTSGSVQIAVACQIARAFRDKPPSVEALQRMFDMSRATAYRWRRSWLDANGMAA